MRKDFDSEEEQSFPPDVRPPRDDTRELGLDSHKSVIVENFGPMWYFRDVKTGACTSVFSAQTNSWVTLGDFSASPGRVHRVYVSSGDSWLDTYGNYSSDGDDLNERTTVEHDEISLRCGILETYVCAGDNVLTVAWIAPGRLVAITESGAELFDVERNGTARRTDSFPGIVADRKPSKEPAPKATSIPAPKAVLTPPPRAPIPPPKPPSSIPAPVVPVPYLLRPETEIYLPFPGEPSGKADRSSVASAPSIAEVIATVLGILLLFGMFALMVGTCTNAPKSKPPRTFSQPSLTPKTDWEISQDPLASREKRQAALDRFIESAKKKVCDDAIDAGERRPGCSPNVQDER